MKKHTKYYLISTVALLVAFILFMSLAGNQSSAGQKNLVSFGVLLFVGLVFSLIKLLTSIFSKDDL